ncbi:hypothetical protein TYRP_012573 [Tyrophagus putrescentiae]|nr:hypothetical protein TYRP_012573 [Tyrophagus putrescentiae]
MGKPLILMRSTDNFCIGACLWSRYRIDAVLGNGPFEDVAAVIMQLVVEFGERSDDGMKLLSDVPPGCGCWKTMETELLEEMTFCESACCCSTEELEMTEGWEE